MLSLAERVEHLEADLVAAPPRISAYHDLPFAILRYEPEEEWEMRRHVKLLAPRLRAAGKELVMVSLAELYWKSIDESEGLEVLVALERERGFEAAQKQVNIYFSDPDWRPLRDLLAERLRALDPERHVAFLTRAGVLAPASYHVSKLLDEMKGRTRVPTILLYPGGIEGTHGLRYMNLKDREPMGNYRVKIYG